MIGKSFEKQRTHTLLGLVLALTLAAHADTVTTNMYYMVSGQSSGTPAFSTANWKLNGSGDAVAPSAGADGAVNNYIVNLSVAASKVMRTPNGGVFDGDILTIGEGNNSGAVLLKNGNAAASQMPVYFKRMILNRGMMVAGGDNGTHTVVASNGIEVTSSSVYPFYFTGAQNRTIILKGDLASQDNAVIKVNRYSLDETKIGNEHKGSLTLQLEGTNTAYKGKWIVDGATRTNGYSDNSLITLQLGGVNALGHTNLTECISDKVVLTNGACLAFSDEVSVACTNLGVTVNGSGSIKNSSSDQLTFCMPVAGYGVVSNRSSKIIKFNNTTSGSVTIDNCGRSFRLGDNFKWNSTGRLYLEGEDVSVASNTVFCTAETDAASHTYDSGDYWSNGKGVDSEHEYLIWTLSDSTDKVRAIRTPKEENLKFSGERLTLAGTSSKSASLFIKSSTIEVEDLRLGRNGQVGFYQFDSHPSYTQILSGNITIAGDDTVPSFLRVGGNRTAAVSATLKGDGALCVMPYKNPGVLNFSGTNTSFKGSIKAAYKDGEGKASVRFSVAENVGCNPDELLLDGLEVDQSEVIFAGNMNVAQTNRGMTVTTSGTINVTNAGDVVTWAGPFSTTNSTVPVTKEGEGTIVFTGAVSNSTWTVNAGEVVIPTNCLYTLPSGATTYVYTNDMIHLCKTTPTLKTITQSMDVEAASTNAALAQVGISLSAEQLAQGFKASYFKKAVTNTVTNAGKTTYTVAILLNDDRSDYNNVIPTAGTMTLPTGGGVSLSPGNVKRGLYYGIGTCTDPKGVPTDTSFIQATDDSIELSNNSLPEDESKVLYYRVQVSDTASGN